MAVLHRTSKDGLGAAYLAAFRWGLERGYDTVTVAEDDRKTAETSECGNPPLGIRFEFEHPLADGKLFFKSLEFCMLGGIKIKAVMQKGV